MKLKVIYLTTSALPNLALANFIKKNVQLNLCGVAIEKPGRAGRISQLFKGKNLFKKIDIAAFRFLHRLFGETEFDYAYNLDLINEMPCLEVTDINGREVVSFVKRQVPDLIIVKGVSIFTRDFLAAINVDLVNIHSGWLPDYRGVQCGTWPLVKNDFDRLGITFHFVDEGIDTGKIILRKRVEPGFIDTVGLLNFHQAAGIEQHRMIIDSLDQFIKDYRKGETIEVNERAKYSRPYSFIGLTDFISAAINVNRHRKLLKNETN